MKYHRRLIIVPLAAAAVVLAFASVAYACTTIVGSITTTVGGSTCPNKASGGPLCQVSTGTTVTSTGSQLNVRRTPNTGDGNLDPSAGPGAPDETQWGLYFLRYSSNADGMKSCMGNVIAGEQKVGNESEVQGTDDSVTISGPIPGPRTVEPPGSGNARVCLISEGTFLDPNAPNYDYGTPSTDLVLV